MRLTDADADVRWVVQVVPGAAGDGDVLAATAGAVVIDAAVARTIIVTALPRGADDPDDDRTDDRFAARLTITPR